MTKNKRKKYIVKIFNTIGVRILEHPIHTDTVIKQNDFKLFNLVFETEIKKTYSKLNRYNFNNIKTLLNRRYLYTIYDLKYVLSIFF